MQRPSGNRRAREAGLSLTEALMAVVVSVIILTAVAFALATGLKANQVVKGNEQAAGFANKQIEEARNKPFDDLSHLTSDIAADPAVTGTAPNLMFTPISGQPAEKIVSSAAANPGHQIAAHQTTESIQGLNFTVKTYVTVVDPGSLVDGSLNQTRRVTTIVSYKHAGATFRATSSTVITRSRRGLPEPKFEVSTNPSSIFGAWNTDLVLFHTIRNLGVTDAYDVKPPVPSRLSWSGNFSVRADVNNDGFYTPAIDTALTDTNGNGLPDTGNITTDNTIGIFVVYQVPPTEPFGSATVATTIASGASATVQQTVTDTVNINFGLDVFYPYNQRDFTYDAAGRLSTLGFARGRLSYTYSPTTVQLTGLNAPGGIVLGYSYDGALLTGVTWTGPVTGTATHAYNDDFRVTTENVNGTSSVSFAYDVDGFLTTAGPLNLTRKTENGLITGTTLGGVTHAAGYNNLAELTNYSAAYAGKEIYRVQHAQDAIGLITQQIETIGGLTATNEYTYDTAGRLTGVTRNGTPVTTYTYDSNGNRTRSTGPSGTVSAAYDNQDRLLTYGSASYNYNAHGELQSKTAGGSTTTYQYDALGNLTAATLPGGNVIDYLIDGRNRRIGKKVNGTLVQGFLYQGPLRPITELDGSNAVVSRFVYASRSSIPDFMIKAGVTYRIISDHLSSPRLVIDVASGTVAQRMNYDEFGNVTMDSNPGFQPFGFAGGVYDMDTKLVRYGARDYDAETGRWTARDPIRFAGGQANLYAYVNHDPVNSTDRSGLGGEETGYSHILGWSQGGIAEGKIGGLTWDAKGFVTKDPNGQGLFNVKASLEGPLGRGNLLVELQGQGAFCPSRPVGSVWGKANYNVPLGYGFSLDAKASFEAGLNGKGTWNAEAVGEGYGFELGVGASGDFSGNAQIRSVLIFPFK